MEKKTRINLLVKEIGKDNIEAFEELYHLIYKELFYFLKRYTYDKEDIEDVIDKTFMIVLEKSKNLLFYENCYSWIFKIARYQIFNKNRKIKPEISLEDIKVENIETKDIFSDIYMRWVVDKLPKDLKLIYYLKYREEYKLNEITKMTKLSVATIKRRIAKIKEILKENMNEKTIS